MRTALRKLLRHLREEHTEPHKLGLAVALGMFIGASPLYGLHLPISIAGAWLLRLNKATVYLAANISNPLMAPFLIAAALAIGQWLRFGTWLPIDPQGARDFIGAMRLLSGQVPDLFLSALLGGAVLGVALAAVFGPLAWLWARQRAA